jgi:hypothetical protein
VITSVKNKTRLMEFDKVIFHFLCTAIHLFWAGNYHNMQQNKALMKE